MEIATNMFQHNMHIVVKDQGHGPIGEANVPLSIFTTAGPKVEMIHINTGGWIKLRSEFMNTGNVMVVPNQPQIAVVQQP
jgi:hypothetical protein